MGRRQGARRAHPAPFLNWGEKPEQPECKNGAGCNRRATQPPAHFHRNPLGGPFFRVARSSRIDSDTIVATASPARTALKNSQLTCGERHAYFGDRTQGSECQTQGNKPRYWRAFITRSTPIARAASRCGIFSSRARLITELNEVSNKRKSRSTTSVSFQKR